jgi:hypothetical protein
VALLLVVQAGDADKVAMLLLTRADPNALFEWDDPSACVGANYQEHPVVSDNTTR